MDPNCHASLQPCRRRTLTSRAGVGVRDPEAVSETYTMWLPVRVSFVPLPVDSTTKEVVAASMRCGMWLIGLQTRRPSPALACAARESRVKPGASAGV